MASALSITSAVPDPALLDLPWDLPLEVWPDEYIAALPKGISRHLVRFVHLGGYVIAIKETVGRARPPGVRAAAHACSASTSRASSRSP